MNVLDRGLEEEAPHALELDKLAPTDYARLPSLSGCLMQSEFCLVFHDMMPDRTFTTVRHFLYWPRPGSQLDKVPRQLLLVSTTAHQNALLLFSLAQMDQGAYMAWG